MQNQLQQLKKLFFSEPLLFFSILLIVALPFYAGQILFNSHAYLLGKYINYLHVRISLHLILSCVVSGYYFYAINRKHFIFFLSTLLLSAILAICPVHLLTQGIGISFSPIYFSSIFHVFEFLMSTTGIIIALSQVLTAELASKRLLAKLIAVSLLIELLFGLAQYYLGAPIFPNFLTWTGQPPIFTSKSIWGIFEYNRIYGTTPHPNILAGILTLFIYLIYSLQIPKNWKYFTLLCCIALLVGTLSKSGILAFIAISTIYAMRNKIKLPSLSTKMASSIIVTLLFLALYVISFGKNSTATYIDSRDVLQNLYSELLFKNPIYLLSGSGFTLAIPNLLYHAKELTTSLIWGNQLVAEPPHNILLLSVIELGVPLTILIGAYITTVSKKFFTKLQPWQQYSLVVMIVILGGLDHYLLY